MALMPITKNNRGPTGEGRPLATEAWTNLSPRERLVMGAILLATALVYLRSLGNGFVSDDDFLILSNPYLGQWSFVWKSLTRDLDWFTSLPGVRYRPLPSIWFALSYHLFGLKPAGWHVLTIAIHLVATWLVFVVACRLTRQHQASLLAAALFGLLPIHAEAVVWPSGFGLVLAGTFMLAAFYFFMRRNERASRNWPLAMVLYGAALLSHESAAAFPALIAWYVLLGEPGSQQEPAQAPFTDRALRAALSTAPFVFDLLLYFFARRHALGFFLSNPHNLANLMTIPQALMTVPRVLAADLMLLALPWMAGTTHQVDVVTSLAAADFYVPAAALIALAGGLSAMARNSPPGRLYLFCAGWIVISLAPMMNLHELVVDQLLHDNYLYYASVGACVMLAEWAVQLAHHDPIARRLVAATAAVLLLSYAGDLWRVQHYWHDDLTLFERCIQEFPQSFSCHNSLAGALSAQGNLQGAALELKRAIGEIERARRENPERAELSFELGMLYAQEGRIADAIPLVAQAAQRPHVSGALAAQIDVTLAGLYGNEGDLAGAEQALKNALRLDPENHDALYALGKMHAQMGRNQEAVSELAQALELTPNPVAIDYVALAELYEQVGEPAQRDEMLRRARSLPDGDEALGLADARIKARQGDLKGAGDLLRDLVRRYPRDPRTWTALGLLLADDHSGAESLRAFDTAQQLSPADPRPYLLAAQELHAMGRDRDALQDCRHALTLAPGNEQAQALENEIARQPPPGRP